MGQAELLFHKYDMTAVTHGQLETARKEIASYEANRLLNTSTDDLVAYFANKYRLDVPTLHRDQAAVDQCEGLVQVPDYFSDDYGRPRAVTGTHIELTVPYSGDREMFFVRPNTFDFNPPRASVGEGHVTLMVTGRALEPEQVKKALETALSEIEKYFGWQKPTLDQFNSQLEHNVREAIEARKKKLLADRSLVANLGFPLKVRPDAQRTYSAPQVRRKITPAPPPASQAAYKPEPALDEANYRAILDIINSMTLVMERSPSAFSEMGEEDLRRHYLVQLNGHFEG